MWWVLRWHLQNRLRSKIQPPKIHIYFFYISYKVLFILSQGERSSISLGCVRLWLEQISQYTYRNPEGLSRKKRGDCGRLGRKCESSLGLTYNKTQAILPP